MNRLIISKLIEWKEIRNLHSNFYRLFVLNQCKIYVTWRGVLEQISDARQKVTGLMVR